MRNDITIDFLAIIDEGVGHDTEIDMTKCTALKSPHRHGRLYERVYHLKRTAPSMDERMDAITYWFRNEMFNLS